MKIRLVLFVLVCFICFTTYFFLTNRPEVKTATVLLVDARGVSKIEALAVANVLLEKNNINLMVWVGNTLILPDKRLHMPEECNIMQTEAIGQALYLVDYYFKQQIGVEKKLYFYATDTANTKDLEIINTLNFKDVDVIIVNPYAPPDEPTKEAEQKYIYIGLHNRKPVFIN